MGFEPDAIRLWRPLGPTYADWHWLREADLHRRSSGYEPDEMLLLYPATKTIELPSRAVKSLFRARPKIESGIEGVAEGVARIRSKSKGVEKRPHFEGG